MAQFATLPAEPGFNSGPAFNRPSRRPQRSGVPMTATTAGAALQKALGLVNAADHRLQK